LNSKFSSKSKLKSSWETKLRDGSEVEVEGPATQTFGPRFVFEKLGPPPKHELRTQIKRERSYRRGRSLYSISLLRLSLLLIWCYRKRFSRFGITAPLRHPWPYSYIGGHSNSGSLNSCGLVTSDIENFESQSCVFATAPRRKSKHSSWYLPRNYNSARLKPWPRP
jgi:hypothetical protein